MEIMIAFVLIPTDDLKAVRTLVSITDGGFRFIILSTPVPVGMAILLREYCFPKGPIFICIT